MRVVGCWLGLGVTEPGRKPAGCAGAVLGGKLGTPPPWLVGQLPQAEAGAGGRDPGVLGAGSPCPPSWGGTQHRADPHL